MKRIYILIWLVVVTLFGTMAMACSKDTSSTQSTEYYHIRWHPNVNRQIYRATGTGVDTPGGLPDIAAPKSLSSYRLSIMNKMVGGAGDVTYMKYEWVRDQKAEHSWMEDAKGKVTEVFIKIGDKYWMWMGSAGMGWIEQQPQTTTLSSTTTSDLVSQIKKMQQDVEHAKVRFDNKGTETVNNLRCTHYGFEYSVTTEMPNLASGGTRKADERSSGEMWIAGQSGVPVVMIKSINRSEITIGNDKTVMDMEYNLTDIGAAITIKPPEGAMTVPTGIPAVPTGIPTLPPSIKPTTPAATTSTPKSTTTPVATTSTPKTTTTTAGTTTSAGGTLIFTDNFQGAWNSGFVWIDPNNDVIYSFTAHPGFLRLTVPDNNDLAGAMNYDAPRLMIPQSGDFTIETLLEFNPQENYQGAGLLVWHTEDRFLRLEFGYGGMGGGEKNVVFVWGEDGGLGLAGSVDLPDTLNRIELRLRRNGDRFSAWYRQVGGTWQEIGSTELVIAPTVKVGIAQVTQYTPSEISADFDYFKVFAP